MTEENVTNEETLESVSGEVEVTTAEADDTKGIASDVSAGAEKTPDDDVATENDDEVEVDTLPEDENEADTAEDKQDSAEDGDVPLENSPEDNDDARETETDAVKIAEASTLDTEDEEVVSEDNEKLEEPDTDTLENIDEADVNADEENADPEDNEEAEEPDASEETDADDDIEEPAQETAPLYEFGDAVYELASGNTSAIYDMMKKWDLSTHATFNEEAVKKGFEGFSDMVAFYTIGDDTDDAPGNNIRESQRAIYAMYAADYSAQSSSTQAVRKAGQHVFVLAALSASWLPLLFLIAFIAMIFWNGSPFAIAGCVVAAIWAFVQIWVSYKQGKGLQRAYDLFRKYGVHRIAKEDGEQTEK